MFISLQLTGFNIQFYSGLVFFHLFVSKQLFSFHNNFVENSNILISNKKQKSWCNDYSHFRSDRVANISQSQNKKLKQTCNGR